MKFIKIELEKNIDTDTEYYNVFEDLKELNNITLELFEREEFDARDLEDLAKLKNNINILNNMIDKKMSEVYSNILGEDF